MNTKSKVVKKTVEIIQEQSASKNKKQEPEKADSLKTTHRKRTSDVISKSHEVKRHPEKDLILFKEVIIKKLDEAKKDNELLKGTLSYSNDHGTNDTSPVFKMMEEGSDVESKEEIAQLALRQEKFIQNLKNALIRIENKTYGICRISGKLIPKERLLSVPHTTLCIDAKIEMQSNLRGFNIIQYPLSNELSDC